LTETCGRTLSDNATLARKVFSSNPAEHEKTALLTILSAQIKLLYGIHERLVFLPREPVERETFSTLQDLFKSEWSEDPSVILTTIQNAYEYRFIDVLRDIEIFEEKLAELSALLPFDPQTSILELPFIDRQNPLSWPFLAHEFGHSIDRRKSITKAIVDRAGEELGLTGIPVIASWAMEVFADFVAARVLGPASILPLFSLELGLSPIIEPSKLNSTHPPTPFRLSLLREFLSKSELSFNEYQSFVNLYQSDQELKFERLGEKAKATRETSEQLLKYVFNRIEPDLINATGELKIFTFTKDSETRANQLKERLRQNVPISAYRKSSDAQIREKLKTMKSAPKDDAKSIYSTLDLLNEESAAAGEILSAGWLYKLETYPDRIRSVFESDPPNFALYEDYLFGIDNLLLKSLQLSSVHRHLAVTLKLKATQ